MSAAAHSDRPWRGLHPDLPDVPTMISPEERALLYWLARDHWTEAGRIVDAGAFLGGSATALAAGVRDRSRPHRYPERPIVSIDDFVLEPYMLDLGFCPGLAPGDDFSEVFLRNLGALEPLCEVRRGDVAELAWDDEPIEVLFLDVLKTWHVNDLATRQLFPRLIPGQSIVVQQDQLYACVPWISITMELFADCFERLDAVGYSSTVYLLARPIPDLGATPLSSDLSAERKLALMDRAIARESGQARAMLELSRVALLRFIEGTEAAAAELDRWLAANELTPALELAVRLTRPYVE